MIAWAFPGQGSQRPRMGADIAPFAALAEHARRAIGIDLARLCADDPDPVWRPEELQQAIFVTSRAAAQVAGPRLRRPDAVVGHSLGEYAALVEAEVLDYDAALHLVDVRGRAMAQAGAEREGGMAAVVGASRDAVAGVCATLGEVWVANANSPAQTVISGTLAALDAASERLEAAGARMVVRLPIAIACHTPLMAPAAECLRAALEGVPLQAPRIRFYAAVDGQPKREPSAIAQALVDGVTQPVEFAATIARMRRDGVDGFVEVGPGRVLRGLLRDNAPGLPRESIVSYAAP